MSEVEQSAPQQEEDDAPVIGRHRNAREIMDLHRAEQHKENQ